MLFEPNVDYVAGAPRGFLSNTIVLPEFAPDRKSTDEEAIRKLDESEAKLKAGEYRILHSFRGRDLAHAILPRADLRRSDFTGANLDRANLDGASLQRSRFNCADRGKEEESRDKAEEKRDRTKKGNEEGGALRSAKSEASQSRTPPPENCARLRNARLHGAKLHFAQFREAYVDGADLRAAELHDAVLFRGLFRGSMLVSAELHRVRLEETDFQEASLDFAKLHDAILKRTKMQNASLDLTEFHGATVDRAEMQGSSFDFAKFYGASVIGTRLQGASMSGAEFYGVRFVNVQLHGANLSDAEFHGSVLNGLRLYGAILDRAEFRATVLNDPELQGSSFKEAVFYGAKLEGPLLWRAQVKGVESTNTSIVNIVTDQKVLDDRGQRGRNLKDFTKETLAQMHETITKEVSNSELSGKVLGRIQRLDPSRSDPEDWPEAKMTWGVLAQARLQDDWQETRAHELKEIVCGNSPRSASKIARGIIRNGILRTIGGQIRIVAESWADVSKCPGARELSPEDLSLLPKPEQSAGLPVTRGAQTTVVRPVGDRVERQESSPQQ
jgi:uncharacterized protein YjbI with pentapeptide repeats